MQHFRGRGVAVGIVLIAAVSAACGATRSYAVPMAGTQMQEAYQPLITCASAKNLESQRNGDALQVKIDETAWLEYGADQQSNSYMAVRVDDKAVPAGELDAKFASSKKMGDDLLACAQGTGAPPAPVVTASPAPMGVGTPDSCTRLMACYTDITHVMCPANEPRCKQNFELKGQADATACQMALDNMAQVVMPMQAARPDFKLPGSCKAGGATTQASGPSHAGGMDWSGNWMASVNYKWTCTVPMSKPEKGTDKGSWSMTISGAAPQLTASVNTSPSGFNLQGSGSDKAMRLCGAFPLKGKGGGSPNTRDNNVCIVISDIASANHVVGHAEGDFQTQFGIPCTVSDAQVDLTR